MGYFVQITKVKEDEHLHYYSVSWGLDDFICYMGIAPKEQKIYVSKYLEFEDKTLYYEVNKPRSFDIFGLRVGGALARAISKGREAIKKNEFPYDISWYS